MLVTMLKLILIHPLFWRILGFGSSIVAFTCFALSPSFHDLFGRWNLFKSAIYGVSSLILTILMLLVKKCRRFTRPVLVKAHVGFLVMMVTSLCSIWQDLVSQKENEENGSRGRILNMCSFGAFGLMSLSLSRQLQLGFEVSVFNFLFGSFLVLLMKMEFRLSPVAAILCYVITNIRSFSDFFMEKLGPVDSSSNDSVLEDIENGSRSIQSQRMNVPEHSLSLHKNQLEEYAERSRIPLPIYQAVNVGAEHGPRFRSTVWIGGKSYISRNVFSSRKAAEKDAARLALKHITTGEEDEGLSFILEGPTSFKSILNDYATKEHLRIAYVTVPQEGLPGYVSSLIFNDKRYTGDPAKYKRDAEQSAACAVVLSNLESCPFW